MSSGEYWVDNARTAQSQVSPQGIQPQYAPYQQQSAPRQSSQAADRERLHTYGSSNKTVLMYGTRELDELEKQTQELRNELRNSHSKLSKTRDEVNKERGLNEELKMRSRSASPMNTPKKADRSINMSDLQAENFQLSSQKERLERDYSQSKRKPDSAVQMHDPEESPLLLDKERELIQKQQQNALLTGKYSEDEHIKRLINIYLDENQRLVALIKGNNGRVTEHDLESMRKNSLMLKEQIEQILNERQKLNTFIEDIVRNNETLKREKQELADKLLRASQETDKWRLSASRTSQSPGEPAVSPRFVQPSSTEVNNQLLAAQQAEQAYKKASKDLQQMIDQMNINQTTLSRIKIDEKATLPNQLKDVQERKLTMSRLFMENQSKINETKAEVDKLREALNDPRTPENQKPLLIQKLITKDAEYQSMIANQGLTNSELARLNSMESCIKDNLFSQPPSPAFSPDQSRIKEQEISNLKRELSRANDDLKRTQEQNSILQRSMLDNSRDFSFDEKTRRLEIETKLKDDRIKQLNDANTTLVSDNQRLVYERNQLLAELKNAKVDLEGNRSELERTQPKLRNISRDKHQSPFDTTAKKPLDDTSRKSLIGQVSKEELDILDQRLLEFDECNKQLNMVISNLQKSIGPVSPSAIVSAPNDSINYVQPKPYDAAGSLRDVIESLDKKIQRIEAASSRNEHQFITMLQDLSTKPVVQAGPMGNYSQSSATAPTYLDPAAIRLILNMHNSLNNEEMEALKAAKAELDRKLTLMTSENLQMESQVTNLISELKRSKGFFEQLSADLNASRAKEATLKAELAEVARKYNFEVDSRKQAEIQHQMTRSELAKLLAVQEAHHREFQNLKRQIVEYSQRKRGTSQHPTTPSKYN